MGSCGNGHFYPNGGQGIAERNSAFRTYLVAFRLPVDMETDAAFPACPPAGRSAVHAGCSFIHSYTLSSVRTLKLRPDLSRETKEGSLSACIPSAVSLMPEAARYSSTAT